MDRLRQVGEHGGDHTRAFSLLNRPAPLIETGEPIRELFA